LEGKELKLVERLLHLDDTPKASTGSPVVAVAVAVDEEVRGTSDERDREEEGRIGEQTEVHSQT
jgi:hypothetical protein